MIDGKECIFCGNTRLLELKSLGFSTTDAILYEDNDFIISPDFVGVVLGHLLIISKAHLHSFGEATHNQWNELLKLESKCNDLLNCDDLLIFEHGAVIDDSRLMPDSDRLFELFGIQAAGQGHTS